MVTDTALVLSYFVISTAFQSYHSGLGLSQTILHPPQFSDMSANRNGSP